MRRRNRNNHRDILVSNRDILVSNRDTLVSNRDILVSNRDILVSNRDILVSNRDWHDCSKNIRTNRGHAFKRTRRGIQVVPYSMA